MNIGDQVQLYSFTGIKVQLDNWPGDTKVDVAKIDTSVILLIFCKPGIFTNSIKNPSSYSNRSISKSSRIKILSLHPQHSLDELYSKNGQLVYFLSAL